MRAHGVFLLVSANALRVAGMRLVLQRVLSASVSVNEVEVANIGRGALVLVGLSEDDTEEDLGWSVDRIAKTRLWPENIGANSEDEGKPWVHSVKSAGLDVLCVSQFTLLASLKKKGRLSFHRAMKPDHAKALYQQLLDKLRHDLGEESIVRDGVFGARMHVSLVNDGPVTICLESRCSDNAKDPPPPENSFRDDSEPTTSR